MHLLPPFFCFWPRWWWRFDCDEIRVVETDKQGRFEALTWYPCDGDEPDIYFWVEYQIGGTWQTVYRPPIGCNTWWNYSCGTEVTLTVDDVRVPICSDEPNLPGKQVAVMSIGNNVSVKEIQGAGAGASEGLTTGGRPFGGRLEPHVWFSRKNLRAAGVKYYRWSYRRLTRPDGTTPDVGPWNVLTRKVGRHYSTVTASGDLSFPFEPMGPQTVSGTPDLFEIRPVNPPAGGIDWVVLDAREDTASAFFQTRQLPHGLAGSPDECRQAEETAGKYELKLELFDGSGNRVNWTSEGIDLKVADDPAPFGTGTVSTIPAPGYYELNDSSGDLVGFRMVLRVDNNCCEATIHPVSGTNVTVDRACGFIRYGTNATVDVSFDAAHPNDFATFNFRTIRGLGTPVPEAITSGEVDDAFTPANAGGPFNRSGDTFSKNNIAVGDLLDGCPNAAFAQRLRVHTMATDGWHRLRHLDDGADAAFALAKKSGTP